MENRYGILLAVIAAALFGLQHAGMAHANTPEKAVGQVGKPAPVFEAVDVTGKRFASSERAGKGKVIVVNFWGLRCSACIQELPHLNALMSRFGDRIEILGVNVDGIDADTLTAQMKKAKIELRYLVAPDPDFRMVDLFGMTAAPLTVLIDPSGILRYRHEGYEPGDEKKIEEVLSSILAGKSPGSH